MIMRRLCKEEEFANGYSSLDVSIESILNGEIDLNTYEVLDECLSSYRKRQL